MLKKIVCINLTYAKDLVELGYEVLNLRLSAGIHILSQILAENNFTHPDAIIQEEMLGIRVLISDIHEMNCPTLFWAIDTHLNMYWQMFYSQLFDCVCTPHISLFNALPEALQIKNLHFFAIHGSERTFIKHENRPFDVQFIGNIDNERTLRRNFGEVLQNFGYKVRQNVPYHTMFDFYDLTRIVPNEAIAFELNYRLLEAASCGTCILSPEIGTDLNLLFERDKEVIVYKDVLHLLDLIKYYIKHPEETEKIGYAAWQKIQNFHTRANRTQTLLSVLPTEHIKKSGYYFYLTLLALGRNNNILYSPALLEEKILAYHFEIDSFEYDLQLSALLTLAAEHELENKETYREQAMTIKNGFLSKTVLFSSYALERDLPNALLVFQQCMETAQCKCMEIPNTLYDLCLKMAQFLADHQAVCSPGFIINSSNQLSLNALELLSFTDALDPYRHEAIHALVNLENVYKYLPNVSLGAYARLSLDNECDWKIRVKLAACYFRCYRLADGIDEINYALMFADKENVLNEAIEYISSYIGEYALPQKKQE